MSDDETKILSDDEKVPTTNMMIETLLLEMREGFAKVNSRFDAVEHRLSSLENIVHSLDRRFDVYTLDLMKLRGDVLNHEKRIGDIERIAS